MFVIIICLLLVGAFAITYHMELVGADSGFDTSYDGGSYENSSSYSDVGDYDFDFDGLSSSSSGEMSLGVILISIYIVFSFIVILCINMTLSEFLQAKKGKSSKNINLNKLKFKAILYLIIALISIIIILLLQWIDMKEYIFVLIFIYIVENLPCFLMLPSLIKKMVEYKEYPEEKIVKGIDNKLIVDEAFKIYKDLQIAWMNFDYDKIKELVSDEMYNMYVNQLETLKIKSQQNIMDDIKFVEGLLIDYKKQTNKEKFKLYLSVECYDYIISTKTKRTVRDRKNIKHVLSYVLTFEKNIEVINYCPQCGASIDNLTECNFCNSKIVNNTSKMKMIKKEIKKQR